MTEFNKLFEKPDFATWENLLYKDLKDLPAKGNIIKTNEFEDLSFEVFGHSDKIEKAILWNRRNTLDQDWLIEYLPEFDNPEKTNKMILEALNMGANAIRLDLTKLSINDIKSVFKDVQTKYIQTLLKVKNKDQAEEISNFLGTEGLSFDMENTKEHLGIASKFISSFPIFSKGANASLEIGKILHELKTYIEAGLEEGISICHLVESVHFEVGISSNYFIQIAKIRVLRQLLIGVLLEYSSQLKVQPFIRARSGFINKSLKDPHTNLLRQTTEVMSSSIGGANGILIEAYDKLSTSGASAQAIRMAINISLLLKEESYFDKVKDALGGSYSTEELCDKLADKSWQTFQEMLNNDDIESYTEKSIKTSSDIIVASYRSNDQLLLGVNKYHNPYPSELKWDKDKLTPEQLIIELKLAENA